MIGDRALVSPRGITARALRLVDRTAFRRSDLVIADTAAQARYFADAFGLPAERVGVCFVGAEDRLFRPGPACGRTSSPCSSSASSSRCTGSRPSSALRLCARTSSSASSEAASSTRCSTTKPENVRHERWAEYERLPDLYRSAGCALGIFGPSAKAARVIPNKAFQALATQTPLITADTPAARELLEDGRDALLVPPADPEALALAVRRLASDPVLGAEIAARGHATYAKNASEDVLGRRWRDLIERLISDHPTGARATAR